MRYALIIIFVVFLMGCNFNGTGIVPSQLHHDFFFTLSSNEKIVKFREYDIETQYELVIIGNQLVEPSQSFLYREFASRGSAVIPFLSKKLVDARNEATIRDIVAIFSKFSYFNLCAVKNNENLMFLMNRRVEAMQGQWKRLTQEMLHEIEEIFSFCDVRMFDGLYEIRISVNNNIYDIWYCPDNTCEIIDVDTDKERAIALSSAYLYFFSKYIYLSDLRKNRVIENDVEMNLRKYFQKCSFLNGKEFAKCALDEGVKNGLLKFFFVRYDEGRKSVSEFSFDG